MIVTRHPKAVYKDNLEAMHRELYEVVHGARCNKDYNQVSIEWLEFELDRLSMQIESMC